MQKQPPEEKTRDDWQKPYEKVVEGDFTLPEKGNHREVCWRGGGKINKGATKHMD